MRLGVEKIKTTECRKHDGIPSGMFMYTDMAGLINLGIHSNLPVSGRDPGGGPAPQIR